MELIFMYIKNYKNLRNLELNLSNTLKVSYYQENMESGLIIQERNSGDNFFGSKVKNITAVIGKNGVGKTNILDLLGMRQLNRRKIHFYNNKYLFIYSLGNSRFVFEGNDIQRIKNSISNLPDKIDINSNSGFNFVAKKINNTLVFEKLIESSNDQDREDISIFSFRHYYPSNNLLPIDDTSLENESTPFFNRFVLEGSNISYFQKYSTLLSLNGSHDYLSANNNILFDNKGKREMIIKTNLPTVPEGKISLNISKGFLENSIINSKSHEVLNARNEFLFTFLYELCNVLAVIYIGYDNLDNNNYVKKIEHKINNKIESIEVNNNYNEYYLHIIQKILFLIEGQKNNPSNTTKVISYIEKISYYINNLEQSWFEGDFIRVPLESTPPSDVTNFLRLIDSFNPHNHSLFSLNNFIEVEFLPFSSGEEALLNLYSSIHEMLSINKNNGDTAVIVLDEPETHLHPEWSRLLVYNLILFLENIDTDFKHFQLIISTHSPFIVSDLPNDNIIALENNGGYTNQVDILSSFAANIHTLLYQEFFMSSTIGEFAKHKINNAINLIKKNKPLNTVEKNEIEYLLTLIDEPILKLKLQDLIDKIPNKNF